MPGCLAVVVLVVLALLLPGACAVMTSEPSEECQQWTEYAENGGDPDVAWDMVKETC